MHYMYKEGRVRELSPREVEAVEYYGEDIVAAFPIEGPTGQRYVPGA